MTYAKAKLATFAGSSLLLLSACGLIPPIGLGDPFGLNGQRIDATVVEAGGVTSRALDTYTATGEVEVIFDNVEVSSPILPNIVDYVFNIGNTLTVSSADGTYPETIGVTTVNFEGTVSDAARNANGFVELSGNAVYTRAAGCEGAAQCQYSLSGAGLASGTLEIDGVRDIVFGGPEPNTAKIQATFTLMSDPGLAVGSTLGFTLVAGDATAKGF